MNKWVVLIIILLIIGQFADIIRFMRMTVRDRIFHIEVGIRDVRKQAESIDFDRKDEVMAMLDEATNTVAESKTKKRRAEVMLVLDTAAKTVNEARRIVDAHTPEEE